MTLYYAAFFGPKTPGHTGQQNLAREIRRLLTRVGFEDLSPQDTNPVTTPSLGQVIAAMHRLLLARTVRPARSGSVTVVDMVHSLASLDMARAQDRLIVIGHDSYALRTLRDLRAARTLTNRTRLFLSWLGWRYVERLLERLAWRALFVSPLDGDYAVGSNPADTLAIPVDASLRAIGQGKRANAAPHGRQRPRLLVSLAVSNPNQLRVDRELIERLAEIAGTRAEVVLWGKGAADLRDWTELPPDFRIVEWVDDYAGFLSGFDLLVYPRMIGSGFHTKLAEALTLGVECLCVDWIAEPLHHAGYDAITTFSDAVSFSQQLSSWLDSFAGAAASKAPTVPAKAEPEAALAPLLAAIAQAQTKEGDPDDE